MGAVQKEHVSLGEYVRRLRRAKGMSLYALAAQTGLSYSHLSRIENDSTLPGPETVAKIAEALGGDLKLMLERANCLPRAILDRIMSREESQQSGALRRTAGQGAAAHRRRAGATSPEVLGLARSAGLDENEALDVAEAVQELINLPKHQREAVVALIATLRQGDDEPPS